jgi:hypothetical protein
MSGEQSNIGRIQEALTVLVILCALGFSLMMGYLTRPPVPPVAVTTPLAVLEPPKPAVIVLGHLRHVVRKPVVVIPVVVGAADCPDLDDGKTPCRSMYEFRQRCSKAQQF